MLIPSFQCVLFFKKTTTIQSWLSCSEFCVGFFSFLVFSPLQTFLCLGCAMLPSDAVQELKRKFPNISFATSFPALAPVPFFYAFCI